MNTQDIVYGAALRAHWDLREDMTFLNNASFGATPRVVMQAQSEWRARMERQPVEFVMRTQGPAVRAAAEEMAAFLGADAQDFAFVDNASMGVSTVVHALLSVLKPGDELLTTTHVYNAVRQTMKHVASLCGAVVTEVEVPFPLVSADDVRARLRAAMSSRTRFVVVDHITSPTGCIFPVEGIIEDCRERGILVMIDGAHAPGMLPLDLTKLDADWYTGNFHKWMYAPKGSAFLWTRRDRQHMTHPLVPSHGYGQGYTAEFDFIGTKDWSPYTCAVDGLRFFERMGGQRSMEYNRSLNLTVRRMLLEAMPQHEPCPESMLGFLAAVVLPIGLPAAMPSADRMALSLKLHDRLWDEHAIEVPIIPFGPHMMVRTASHVFNEPSEYLRLVSVLTSLVNDMPLQE
ncbi:MAG: aminotransferase class V-fold PLP-dependent enzyme [Candidatus Kapaibacterium sp.]